VQNQLFCRIRASKCTCHAVENEIVNLVFQLLDRFDVHINVDAADGTRRFLDTATFIDPQIDARFVEYVRLVAWERAQVGCFDCFATYRTVEAFNVFDILIL
jgi:hypothetical protein